MKAHFQHNMSKVSLLKARHPFSYWLPASPRFVTLQTLELDKRLSFLWWGITVKETERGRGGLPPPLKRGVWLLIRNAKPPRADVRGKRIRPWVCVTYSDLSFLPFSNNSSLPPLWPDSLRVVSCRLRQWGPLYTVTMLLHPPSLFWLPSPPHPHLPHPTPPSPLG